MQIKLTTYDPSRSSTDGALSCRDSNCGAALGSNEVSCTSAGYCAYSTTYGDGSSTQGYFIQDVMTFQEIHNNTQVNGTASVYFGSGFTNLVFSYSFAFDTSASDLHPRETLLTLKFGVTNLVVIDCQRFRFGARPSVILCCSIVGTEVQRFTKNGL